MVAPLRLRRAPGNGATAGPQGFIATLPAIPYIISGPYYDDNGYVANSDVQVAIRYTTGETEYHTLNGTSGTADSVLLNPNYVPEYVSWQAIANSSYTRMYYIDAGTATNVTVLVPNPSATPQIYQFTISDFYGMSNPYIRSSIVVNGNLTNTDYIVERKPLTVGTVSFVMEQWHSYTITFECDQGLHSQVFSAEGTFLTNLEILPFAFATVPANGTTVEAFRVNATMIKVNYADGDNSTSWIYFNITHTLGVNTLVDYPLNVTGSSTYTLTWNLADSATDYMVTVQSSINGTLYTWMFSLGAPVPDNPWENAFEFLGNWPTGLASGSLVAAGLIVLALLVGSYSGVGVACVAAWIVGGICIAMGWFPVSIPTFSLAGFFSVFIAIGEWKDKTREV